VEVVEFSPPSASVAARRWWDLVGVGLAARRAGVDLLHCTGIYPPLVASVPVALTVHDLAIRRVPGVFPARNRWLGWPVWSTLARRADHLVAVSEATRRDLLTFLDVRAERVSVLHHGVDDVFRDVSSSDAARVAAAYGLGPAYFLVVGTLEPRKNLPRTLHAFQRLLTRGARAQLVIVGGLGWGLASTHRKLLEGGFGPEVRYLGHVPDADLAGLYAGAVGLVYPSLYEGFGLPVLEAMASGCPVITSARGGLAEVGSDAVRVVDPLCVGDVEEAMGELLCDGRLREQLRQRGRERAAGSTWRRAAEQTLHVYRLALAEHGTPR
jgi:alpha-1,3-rhamnosyl/mannosyltransferase